MEDEPKSTLVEEANAAALQNVYDVVTDPAGAKINHLYRYETV